MKKIAALLALALCAIAVGAGTAAAGTRTVNVTMRDPGCHWFLVGGKYLKTLSVTGPVFLLNTDMAALRIAGASGVGARRRRQEAPARAGHVPHHDGRPGARRQPSPARRQVKTTLRIRTRAKAGSRRPSPRPGFTASARGMKAHPCPSPPSSQSRWGRSSPPPSPSPTRSRAANAQPSRRAL
jgi:hypothetical protein